MELLKHARCNMRPHVCIPSGCQQWVSKTIAIGIDKFAYMSSLAIYVYSSITFLPLAILAKYEERLSALALSPFDANLLACATTNQEVRVYDVETELLVCRAKYASPKASITIIEWHKTHPGLLLLAVGSGLVALDFAAAAGAVKPGGGHSNKSVGGGTAVAQTPPQLSSPSPPSHTPRSSLLRFRSSRVPGNDGGGGGGGGDGSMSGRWVALRDLGAQITAFDQCNAVAASGGSGGGGGTSSLIAVATSDSRVVILELDASVPVVRRELRTIALPDTTAGPSVLGASLEGLGPACAVCWEPLSGNGLLLIVGRSGVMVMYDTTVGEVVLSYGKQPATATRFAQFLPSQPGNFLLSSSRSGALQLWNVSQSQPVRVFKLGGGLVQGFALLRTPRVAVGDGGGDAKARTAVLVSFSDGAVYLYDLTSQQVLWKQDGGHTETVFDCRFCTTDPNLLATASFDSTVRVWDVRTARCVKHLLGAEGILYSVSWSSDGRLLASSNDAGVIYLYDYDKGMLVKALRQHTKQCLRVTFHPLKPGLMASGSQDGSVLVYSTDGEVAHTLRHSAPVSCVAWSPLSPGLLATTSEEGELLLWDTHRPPHLSLVRRLVGHKSRTFGVEFSPLIQDYLLSSSNDRTARLWDVSRGACLAVLSGHTAEVRAVAWHPEIATVCFTGSWDASVRVWNIRSGQCLHVSNDHHADVYGIACHPRRPFFLATCSRDNTLRLWSTLGLNPGLLSQAIVCPLSSLRSSAAEAAALPPAATPLLSGPASQELVEKLAAPGCSPLERFAALTEFFMPPACVDVLWDIARYARYGTGSSGGHISTRQRPVATFAAVDGTGGVSGSLAVVVGGDDGSSLHHWTVVGLTLSSAANHMELAATSKTRPGHAAVRREELLREAAQQHLVAGNLEHCCELLAELGEWDRALALAPGVGLGLWRRLVGQRLRAMAMPEAQSQVSDVIPLYLVSGQVTELVELLSASGMYDTAFNVAAVQANEGYPSLAGSGGGTVFRGGDLTSGGGGGGGGGRERDNSNGGGASSAIGGELPKSSSFASLPASSSVNGLAGMVAAPPPPVLEVLRSSIMDTSVLATVLPPLAPLPTSSSIALGGGSSSGGGSLGGAPLPPPLPPLLSSTSSMPSPTSTASLPPLTVRGGALPSLNRSPSLRPQHLMPIQLSSTAALPTPAPVNLSTGLNLRPDSPPNGLPTVTAAAVAAAAAALPEAASVQLPLPPTSPSLASTWSAAAAAAYPQRPSSPRAPTPPSNSRNVPSPGVRYSRAPMQSATEGGAGSAAAAISVSGTNHEVLDRAVAVRCAQARAYLAQGLPLQAACCALSVDDVAGAVGLLLRGGQEEMALALVQGLSSAASNTVATGVGAVRGNEVSGGYKYGVCGLGLESSGGRCGGGGGSGVEAEAAALRPRVLLAAAARREAAADYLMAAELLRQVPSRPDLLDLLGARCRAHADPPTTASVFRTLGLREPGLYATGAETPGVVAADAGVGWEGVRRLLLAGQQAAAADRALAGVRGLLAKEDAGRVSGASAEWEQAWAVINSLCASALDPVVWCHVFSVATYLGALMALEQGCAAVGLYLVRVLEDWVARQPDAELPIPQSRLAAEVSEALDECLALPAYGSTEEVRATLVELLMAPPGSAWLQGLLHARLARIEAQLTTPLSPGARGICSPPHHPLLGCGGPSGSEGLLLVPTPSSPRHSMKRLGANTVGSSVRLNALEVGATGVFSVGGGQRRSGGFCPASSTVGTNGSEGGCRVAALSRGPVVVAAAHVPSRSYTCLVASGALPISVMSGAAVRGAAVQLDDGTTWLSLSEALALRRVIVYSPLGTHRLLLVP